MTADGTVFDRIRKACERVASMATHVSIDHDRLAAFADRIDLHDHDDDPAHAPIGDDEEAVAAHVMTLDAINFGSGYFPFIRKRPGHSGYHTVAASLADHIHRDGPPTTPWLRDLTSADCGAIFDQPHSERRPAELMELFATALNDLGVFVDRAGGGRFSAVLDAADHRAERLVTLLDEMPYYRDVHHYRGFDVPLYKRAQITAFDVATALDHHGPARFDDLDRLTMFADNLVPHVLRIEGVLELSEELVARIEAQDDIPVGSDPEIEIRACGLHAVELLVDRLGERGVHTTAGRLDGVLWRMGATERYKAVPRHRTRCVFY